MWLRSLTAERHVHTAATAESRRECRKWTNDNRPMPILILQGGFMSGGLAAHHEELVRRIALDAQRAAFALHDVNASAHEVSLIRSQCYQGDSP